MKTITLKTDDSFFETDIPPKNPSKFPNTGAYADFPLSNVATN